MRPSTFTSLLLLALAGGLIGCGDGLPGPDPVPDASGNDVPTYRAPTLTTVQPPTVSVSGPAFVLVAAGTFDPDAIVLFDGVALTTRVISATSLEADVPATAIEMPGRRTVQVVHTGDGGGLSATQRFDVIDGIAGPVLDQLAPDRLIVGNPAATVLIDGWNFTPTSVALWGGSPRPTTYLGSFRLSVALTAADFLTIRMVDVTVATPGGPPVEAPLVFTIEDVPQSPIGVLERVSVTPAGGDLVGGVSTFGGSPMSTNGRYVAFISASSAVVAGDANGSEDVFIRDTCHGAAGCTPTTIRASQDTAGGDPDGGSFEVAISATGRYIAFSSSASDLIATDTTDRDIFWRDTCIGATGCTPSTTKASIIPADGSFATYGPLGQPAISGDGRFVAFYANGGNPVQEHVWLHDTCLGAASCTPNTTLISHANDGTPGNLSSEHPALSFTGRFVAFGSRAQNLDGQLAVNTHAYVVDTCHGATGCTRSITRATVALDGVSEAEGFAKNISITPNGRYVGFTTYGMNLTAETFGDFGFQVFFRDTCIGATNCTPSTVMVSKLGSTTPNGSSYGPAVSTTGRYVAFMSRATDLVVNDTNNEDDMFVRDLCTEAPVGCMPTTRRVSVTSTGVESNGASGNEDSGPWISGDGSITAWSSSATNLVPNDGNATVDTFVAGTGFPQ